MKRNWRTLLRPYQTALNRHLVHGTAASLQPARRIGQRAVAGGLETLDLARVHKQALLAPVLAADTAANRRRTITRGNRFFAEAIIPLEQGHHTARAANARLSRMNLALSRRSRDLADSNRQLKQEVARRQVVEESLRQSEQHSGHLLEQSRRLQEELRLLSRRILSVQEEERKRISRELHDVIAQVLTGINVQLAVLKTEAAANTKGLSRNIARTQRLVERSVDIVHRFAHDLRPAVLDHLGLIAALHAYLKIFAKETGIRVSLTASPAADRLDSTLRTTLYRVAQEALTNVARHARASRAEVVIGRHGSELWMHIRDNGCAFSVEQVLHARKRKRMGLLGMRERMEMVGGRFRVESAPGHGTTVHAQIPFSATRRKDPPP